MSNVIEFPKIKVDSPPQSPDELEAKIAEYKEEYSNEIAEFIWRQAIGELVRSGCDFAPEIEKPEPPQKKETPKQYVQKWIPNIPAPKDLKVKPHKKLANSMPFKCLFPVR